MFNHNSELVVLKDDAWFVRQKHAGQCVASVLNQCEQLILNKTHNLSLKDLESSAIKIISEYNCTPTFKGYKGFPSAICTSVNEQLVHGIVTDYVLKEGDVITVDLGATYEGAIADAANTFVYGNTSNEITRMIGLCKQALYAGIKAVKIGSKLGIIGDTIHKLVKDSGFGLIVSYGGHGINYNIPHAAPFIANRASVTDGIRIQPGLSIAIEPMLVMGGNTETHVLNDKWTVVANNIGCHQEHSIFVGTDKVYVMTEKE